MNARKHFVFRLGPVDRDDGQFFMYYVYPGIDHAWAFPAASDAQAFELILDVYPSETLCCEPSLSLIGAEYGIDPQAYDDLRSHELSLMAYEHLPDRPLRDINQEGLIFHFLHTVRRFIEAQPWKRASSQSPISIKFSGNLSFPTSCFVHPKDDLPIFTILLEPDVVDTKIAGNGFERVSGHGHLGIELRHAPQFAVDALQRAYTLGVVPVPYVFRDGHRAAVTNLQISLLITAMIAVLFHEDNVEGGLGEFHHGDISLVAGTHYDSM